MEQTNNYYSFNTFEFLERAKKNYQNYSTRTLPPTFIGFNMNLDYIIKIGNIDILSVFYEGINNGLFPKNIIQNFTKSFKQGAAREIVIEKNISFDLLKKMFPKGRTRIGGQLGLMAEYISKLFPNWEIHGFLLGEKKDWKQYGVVLPDINWITTENPFSVQDINTHLILEYEKGDEITDVNGNVISAPRENRFIIAFEPELKDTQVLSTAFLSYIKNNNEIKSAILAGIHLPWFKSSLKQLISAIKKIRDDLLLHLEWTHIEKYYSGLSELIQLVHSLGFNEQEGIQILSLESSPLQTANNASSFDISRILRNINNKYSLTRLHGHSYGYYAIKDDTSNITRLRQALMSSLIALLVCGTNNYSINELTPENIKGKFNSIHYKDNVSMFYVPLFKNPLQTVGLGDSISISGFAVYLADKLSV